MDLFYRMGSENGYRTDGEGGRLAYTGVSVTLSNDGTESLRKLFAKKDKIQRGIINGDDADDLHRFLGFCGPKGRAVVGIYLDELEDVVFVKESIEYE